MKKTCRKLLALTLFSATATQVQAVVWDASVDTDWSAAPDSTSWSGGTFNNGNAADFNGAGAGTVNITGAVNPSVVNVTSGNYTFAAGGGSIGGSGALNKSGAGTLIIQTNNSFTGGVNLSGGTIQIADNNANEAGYFGAASNIITFSGNATIFNANNPIVLPQGIQINNGVTASLTGAFAEQTLVDGVLSGNGNLSVTGFSANFIVQFRNTANTFTGSIDIQSSDFVTVGFRSLQDSPGATTIGLDSQANNGAKFEYMSGAIAPLVLTNRQFVLTTNGSAGTNLSRQPSILSNAAGANTITINSDLAITGTGFKRFVLGGSNTGNNTFAGAIIDAIGSDVLQLHKQGGGKWVLAGTNTYQGDTLIEQGNLTLASTGSLLFNIGANGVNNRILGDAAPGTLTLDGSFIFDLTGADTTIGNTWNILDSTILGFTTFNPSFNVNSFTNAGSGVWTLDSTGVQYQFDQTTGVLSTLELVSVAVPEPATATLALLGLGGMMMRRRRLA